MSHFTQLVINHREQALLATTNTGEQLNLSFEYLRVFAPQFGMNEAPSKVPEVFHKKNVQLQAIEPLAKHGHRFIFDDQHQAVFSNTYILQLAQQHSQLWPQYLKKIEESIQGREESIAFKEVK